MTSCNRQRLTEGFGMKQPGRIRQREAIDPDGPDRVLEEERRQELVLLPARLLRQAATGKGEGHEPDHA